MSDPNKTPPDNSNNDLPSAKVTTLLGGDIDQHTHAPIFCEMQEIHKEEGANLGTWKEAARWIKFEEDVEEGGDRWSKPHVATLSLHSLFELRVLLMQGAVLIDESISSMGQAVDKAIHAMVYDSKMLPDNPAIIEKVKAQLLAVHEHQTGKHKAVSVQDQSVTSLDEKQKSKSVSGSKFQRHIPKGSEAANMLVGTMDCLEHPIMCFIKLKESVILPGLCEVDIPTRFIFILIGGPDFTNYYQIGRSFSTLMSDQIFHEIAYKCRNREDLLTGIDEFLDKTTVLPPGEWDPRIRIEPPSSLPVVKIQDRLATHPDYVAEDKPAEEHGDDPALARTGKLFGGLMADIKRKAPFYWSDYKDCLSLQCLSSYFFLYFAIITPVITFGGLWADATQQNIAAMESIFGAAISGFVYHLFSGQPLTIIGATGPILVFDTIVYSTCAKFNIPFLSFRLWIGFWTGLICLVLVATDASYLVKYITRYTEESFSTLISLIFMIDGAKKILGVNKMNTMWLGYDKNQVTFDECACTPPNWNTARDWNSTRGFVSTRLDIQKERSSVDWSDSQYLFKEEGKGYICMYSAKDPNNYIFTESAGVSVPYGNATLEYKDMSLDMCRNYCGVLVGDACEYTRDVFLFSFCLSIGTFILATYLKGFKFSTFFPTKVRTIISDFGVTAAIVIMVFVDMQVGISTPKLKVPTKFQPTLVSQRGWLIPPFGTEDQPLSTMMAVAAILPAIPATILVFLDQQITAVIVNRRENQLKKGAGYHLDLFIVAIMIIICSFMGLPWFVAATVLSITHVNSLKQESESSAPGEKAKFLGCREQRVTGLLIFLSIGLSVFAVGILNNIPMPVLYGVFLYMGVSSLKGVQLVDRLVLLLMPSKHQPDYVYLRHVPLPRVHLFTCIQVIGLALLWIIKKSSDFSICFPLMVAAIIFIRKSFDWFNVFTQRELSWLDDVMDDDSKKEESKKNKKARKVEFSSPHASKPSDAPNDDINISMQIENNPIIKSIPNDIHVKENEENKSLLA